MQTCEHIILDEFDFFLSLGNSMQSCRAFPISSIITIVLVDIKHDAYLNTHYSGNI